VNNLFREVSNRVDRIFKSMILAAAAGAAAVASLFFFSLAAFLLLGGKKPAPQAPPPKPVWQDPLVVSLALQLVKSVRPPFSQLLQSAHSWPVWC
jgi:hypothetical protein